MTEAEWLACDNPKPMLSLLTGRISDRKLRLFACACCRAVREFLEDGRSRAAVSVSERFADGVATNESLRNAELAAAMVRDTSSGADWIRAIAAKMTAARSIPIQKLVDFAVGLRGLQAAADHIGQSQFLRCIVGPVFREPAVGATWLSWNSATIPRLAESIYTDRAFDRLPILADALEEAGCTDAAILSHCRGPGPHVRGCWVVDLLLGKE